MATTLTGLMTAEEFWDFCQLPENQGRNLELHDGEVVEVSRAGIRHGVVCANVVGLFWNFVFQRNKGYVASNDTGLIVERDPDSVQGPDVFLYDEIRRYEELPVKWEERPPSVIVDVLSPNDRPGEVLRRVGRFQQMNVPLLWIVDPETRSVFVYRLGQSPVMLGEADEITGMDVVPDLRLRVADLFRLPGEERPPDETHKPAGGGEPTP